MNHNDHVALLENGIAARGGVWADLGSGTGAFTLALAELLGSEAVIYSVDRDRGALREQERRMQARFPEVTVTYLNQDFTAPLRLPSLDGILMANSLHFIPEKQGLLHALQQQLKPTGRFMIVEYNVDRGNRWVPYPLSFVAWSKLAAKVGLGETRLTGRYPSRFLREIYAAVSVVADSGSPSLDR